jgi:preprotein translocase subunit YajC
MEPLFIIAVTAALLWVIFILPQQRRVRAHQALVASLQPGDRVILTAGIYGRIVELGPEDITLEIAPEVEIRAARQAVLRIVEDAISDSDDDAITDSDDESPPTADGGAPGPAVPDPDNRGPAAPGPNV